MTPFSWNVRCQVSWAMYLRIVFLELLTLLISSLKCCDYRHSPYPAHFPWFLILVDSGVLQASFSLLHISTLYSWLLTHVLLQEYYLVLFSGVVDYVALLVRYYCQLDTIYLKREDFNWKIKTLAWEGGMSLRLFLDYQLRQEEQTHCGWHIPKQVGLS